MGDTIDQLAHGPHSSREDILVAPERLEVGTL